MFSTPFIAKPTPKNFDDPQPATEQPRDPGKRKFLVFLPHFSLRVFEAHFLRLG
jgi:hypothetical protein